MNFLKTLNLYQKRVNNFFFKTLNKLSYVDKLLIHSMKYSFLGGKRLRPFLVYATGDMFKSNLNTLDIAAAAIECIHTYSLIHDDLPSIDNDKMRRGKKTCHVKYGENIAILTGDALQSLAFSILSDSIPKIKNDIRIEMISELSKSIGVSGMCGGQILDILSKKNINLIHLKKTYYYKTSCLIQSAVRMGAIIAKKKSLFPELDKYSKAVGLAFQIKDDILDIKGNSLIMGKNTGSDIKSKKNTYPSLIGLKKSKRIVYQLYQKAIKALNIISKKNSINTYLLKNLAHFIIKRNK